MRSCPRHSRTLARCLAPSRGHSKTTPQRSAGRAVRSTELVPFSTSDEWYSRHRPVWFRLRRVRERMVVTPEPPLAYARGSYTPLVTPAQPHAWLTSRDREGADGRDTRTTACLRARLGYAARDPPTTACMAYEPRP